MIDTLKKELKTNPNCKLFLLYGTEEYFLNEALQMIVKKFLPQGKDEFNFASYDMEEQVIEEALEDACTPSFFGDGKVIVIRNPLFLTSQKEKIVQNVDALQRFLDMGIYDSVIVFHIATEKLDERKKIVKNLKKVAFTEGFQTLKANELHNWVENEGKKRGLQMEREGIEALIHAIGSTVAFYKEELNKLELFLGENGVLTKEVVEQLSYKTVEQNVFQLMEYVLKRDRKEAIEIYHELLAANEEPIKIVALLLSQFRLLYITKTLSEQGYSQYQIADKASVNPYRIKKAMPYIRRFDEDTLKHFIKECVQLEYELKSMSVEKKFILERFLLRL